jgi:hypothetical protein
MMFQYLTATNLFTLFLMRCRTYARFCNRVRYPGSLGPRRRSRNICSSEMTVQSNHSKLLRPTLHCVHQLTEDTLFANYGERTSPHPRWTNLDWHKCVWAREEIDRGADNRPPTIQTSGPKRQSSSISKLQTPLASDKSDTRRGWY